MSNQPGVAIHPAVAKFAADPQRPQYHFMPPRHWMNDPNGFCQWNGQYHLFYQYNPDGAFHANMHWGHAVSSDLVCWEHLPVALAPTPGGPDKDGVFSGCVVDNGGVPTAVYTGVAPEVQCIATGSADLVRWDKRPEPVIPARPAGLDLLGFRDPCVWRQGDHWCMVIGSGIRHIGGAVLLYKSPDLIQWEYSGPLLVDDSGQRNKVWECPAFFPLDDKWVLIVSVTSWAYVDYFIGSFDGERFYPDVRHRLDYGRYFFAPQTLLDAAGRRVMIGWIQEGRSEAQYREADWSGVQSIPRVLTLLDDSRLSFEPVKEIQHLRRQHYHAENLTLADALPYRSDVEGNQLEILLECQPGDAEEIGVVLAQSPGGEEHTRIVFNRENGELYVDRRCSNARGDVDLETQYAALALRSGEGLKLHIFFDRSVIEIYANDRVCLTSRIYPTRADSRGVSFFARGGSVTLRSVDVWKLASAWE